MNQIEFDKKLMEMMLAGDDPVLEALRKQYSQSTVAVTEYSGAGFFTLFKFEPGVAPVAPRNFEFGDIDGYLKGEVHSGFILFIREGRLSWLEGYGLSDEACEAWPEDYSNIQPVYRGPEGKRNLEELKAAWTK